jgi:DNA-binding NarL/FixJ family response regulator
MPETIRLLIAEDQNLFARMLQTVLETRGGGFEVVGVVANGLEALDRIPELDPDVVLLDIAMPELDGVRTAQRLLERDPERRILVLTTFDDQAAVRETVKAGVAGYVLKDCEPETLFAAIRSVHSGGTYFADGILKRLADPARSEPGRPEPPPPSAAYLDDLLSRREREILLLCADDLENKEIADRLFIAEQTVKNNISRLYEKLAIRDRSRLIRLAAHYRSQRP